ncbi:ribosome biogenesis protein tsr1 [Thelephora terrestris]|uniref:Ribosome biogenesis protein tsr1 n=1 Tax=Thelephora terrestris TaxID=56493 RepID=A0A9P6HCE6_9AGAM|nr:ribosome biogenesis protein tsr1 [Thelephora terrestris]
MGAEAHHHRPTLKQQNKRFKSKHATKHSIKTAAKGKTARQSLKSASTATIAQARQNRRNNAKQIQAKKRQALISATRLFSGSDGTPRIVAVIPLTPDVSARSTIQGLAEVLDVPAEGCPEVGTWRMSAERFKTSLQFIPLRYGDVYSALDACRVADYVVFVLSPTVEVDKCGDTLLRTLQAQGLPDVVTTFHPDASFDPKSKGGVLKSLLSFIQYFVPSQTRVYDIHSSSDRLNALRSLCEGKPSGVRWRENRSYILGEEVVWSEGVLSVTGYVRGSQLSPDRLVHIPGHGDYQIQCVMSTPTSHFHPKNSSDDAIEIEPAVLAEPDPESADSLISTNDPDDLANEQTWPTEEEMNGLEQSAGGASLPDAKAGTTPKRVKRIPKGMSEYQATWIVDSDEEGDEEGHEKDDNDSASMDAEAHGEHGEEEEGMAMEELMEVESKKSVVAFQDLDMEEETQQLKKWRDRKREEEEDAQFPDEVDTPMDVPARTRFQRYRGLRSFRTSPWDPYENLPRDYARIFQFEDFKRTERSAFRKAEEGSGVEPGLRVTVHLKNVPQEASTSNPGAPFVIFGLLKHEHKKTVLHFTVQRNTECEGSVRSKDPLLLCIGPRRLRVNPIYSQHTKGGGKGQNNVHKFEKYLRHGVTNVATIYGPVVFGKQPCILLRENEGSQVPDLVAMGTFIHPDTTRVIAKRIVLSGHPFKLHRKTATVRYMFFNREDINYFKPVQLHTKHGRVGHIKESLGTHGYFKAHFDGSMNQMDTVCMSLYKRVYPKWAELVKDGAGGPRENEDDEMVVE